MQTMIGAIHVVKDIIDSCLQTEQPLLADGEFMVRGQSPDLIALAVAVNLIIAFARHTAIESHAHVID